MATWTATISISFEAENQEEAEMLADTAAATAAESLACDWSVDLLTSDDDQDEEEEEDVALDDTFEEEEPS